MVSCDYCQNRFGSFRPKPSVFCLPGPSSCSGFSLSSHWSAVILSFRRNNKSFKTLALCLQGFGGMLLIWGVMNWWAQEGGSLAPKEELMCFKSWPCWAHPPACTAGNFGIDQMLHSKQRANLEGSQPWLLGQCLHYSSTFGHLSQMKARYECCQKKQNCF